MATILVVDDAAFMRMRMSKILTEAGYEVIQAENGLDAVAKYKANRPDAVLMDITMPEMPGVEAVEEILREDPSARIVMVTSLGHQEIVRRALGLGARYFLTKPLHLQAAAEALRFVLEAPAPAGAGGDHAG